MSFLPPRHRLLAALLLCSIAAGACTDLPTGPGVFQLEAGGTLWTAVAAPSDLPSMESWLRHAPPGPETRAAAARVLELQEESRRIRASGDVGRADALTIEAAQLALETASGVDRPSLIRGLLVMDGWQRDVRESIQLGQAPELAAAVEQVEREREAAAEALGEGRDEEAALRLSVAAEWARSWSPEGVALRVLERVEAQLTVDQESEGAARARHLVHSARHELVAGEPLRAVQRALYALQIADGQAMSDPEDGSRSRCGEYGC